MQTLELTFDYVSYSALEPGAELQPHARSLKKASPKQCANDWISLQRIRGLEAKAMNQIPAPGLEHLCGTLHTQLA